MAALAHDQHVRQVMIGMLAADAMPPATRSLVLEAFAESELGELPQPVIDLLGKFVSHGDPALQQQALAVVLAHDTDRLDPQILQLSRDSAQPVPLRLSVLAILGRHGRSFDRESFALLVSQLSDETLPLDRWTAADALAGADLNAEQLAELAERLSQIGPLELPILLRAFERERVPRANESIGARLVESLERSPALTSLAPQRLQRLAERMLPRLADSAKALEVRLQPDREQQAARLAELEAQMAGGDASRGQTVFFGSRAACAACHRSSGRGGDLGPDLSQIGRIRNARDLLEAIAYPDGTLVNGYESYTVATASGEIHSGLLSHQTDDAVHLRASAAKGKIRIPRAVIAAMAPSRTSLMPAGFDRAIPLADLRDLVAYLQSLK